MRVRVFFFGMLKDLAGASESHLDLPTGATAADLWSALQEKTPALARFERSVAVAVNHEYSGPDTLLHEGDEVALLPPVSGGADFIEHGPKSIETRSSVSSAHCRLQCAPIVADKVTREIRRGEDGAVVMFEGVVRDNSRGRRTLYLEYEAYVSMALDRMEALAVEAMGRFAIRDCVIVHRLGRLEIGETSVLIAVTSAHRAAVFEACRWLIDTLKRTVPIWKKEFFTDGAVWADGDPFPASIPTVSPKDIANS